MCVRRKLLITDIKNIHTLFFRGEENLSSEELMSCVEKSLDKPEMEYLDKDYKNNIKQYISTYAEKVIWLLIT